MNDKLETIALRLNGLNTDDRQWILEKLTEPARRKLRGYLNELSAERIHVPSKAGSEETVSFEGHSGRVSGVPSGLHDEIDSLDVMCVSEIFASEDSMAVALVLASGEWRWTEKVLRAMSAARRLEVMAQLKLLRLPLTKTLTESIRIALLKCARKGEKIQDRPELSRFEQILNMIESEHTSSP